MNTGALVKLFHIVPNNTTYISKNKSLLIDNLPLYNLVWKGIQAVAVLLPPMLISAGNCSDLHVLVRFMSFAKM